jgi:hypothetical protein
MSKSLNLKYYKIEVNDKNKETKCTQMIIWEILTQAKKKHCLNFWNKYWKRSEIERNHNIQYECANKLFFNKIVVGYNSIKDLVHYIYNFKLKDLIIFPCFETKKLKTSM